MPTTRAPLVGRDGLPATDVGGGVSTINPKRARAAIVGRCDATTGGFADELKLGCDRVGDNGATRAGATVDGRSGGVALREDSGRGWARL